MGSTPSGKGLSLRTSRGYSVWVNCFKTSSMGKGSSVRPSYLVEKKKLNYL